MRGNNDPVVYGVPEHRIVDIGGYRIGLVHGWGSYVDLEKRMIDYFSADRLDCLIYGHSHYPVCHDINGMLVLNPGSTTDMRRAPYHSVAMLYLDDNMRGEIINIDVAGQIV
ncbi:MAG: YfcE family phosphodiesterase [Desulfuromonas sp.]|nr:YfcE family phosphodiesterase [Desulfuromonas sp.]